jgi:hypothetical protein
MSTQAQIQEYTAKAKELAISPAGKAFRDSLPILRTDLRMKHVQDAFIAGAVAALVDRDEREK